MKKITVIGGGGTGQTLAADLSRRGYEVSLCEEPGYGDKLKNVSESGGIEISGAIQASVVPLESVPADFAKAVAEADVILGAGRKARLNALGGGKILVGDGADGQIHVALPVPPGRIRLGRFRNIEIQRDPALIDPILDRIDPPNLGMIRLHDQDHSREQNIDEG